MQFKIKNTTFKISFTFLALVLLAITLNHNAMTVSFLFFATVHEFVHLFFIYCFSEPPKMVCLSLFGANIKKRTASYCSIKSEIIINASAPVFNVFTGVAFYMLSVNTCSYQDMFVSLSQVNLVLGLFNLIPFYSFDGGHIIKYFLLTFLKEKTVEQILTAVSLFVTVVFSFISIYIFLNYQHNFSLLVISVYMFLSIIFKKENTLDY